MRAARLVKNQAHATVLSFFAPFIPTLPLLCTALHEELDGKKNVVEFDFLGKDSIRYYNCVPVEKQVFKNLGIFVRDKVGADDLFDRLTVRRVEFGEEGYQWLYVCSMCVCVCVHVYVCPHVHVFVVPPWSK